MIFRGSEIQSAVCGVSPFQGSIHSAFRLLPDILRQETCDTSADGTLQEVGGIDHACSVLSVPSAFQSMQDHRRSP